ncbi:MAG: rod-binding protein [Magnetococcus sp. DMHC-6]
MSQPIAGLTAASTTVKENTLQDKDLKRLHEATADFEAIFIRQMLASMRKTVPDGGAESLFSHSAGEKLFNEMLDGEYANIMSRKPKGLGIKEALFHELTRNTRLTPEQMEGHLNQLRSDENSLTSVEQKPINNSLP